ncbi:MAG: HAMP domain-containing histidine kinase [Firmicutes bacterium]|nr:HAMP domain-containing histidine kinase [Bacillota bacterium]
MSKMKKRYKHNKAALRSSLMFWIFQLIFLVIGAGTLYLRNERILGRYFSHPNLVLVGVFVAWVLVDALMFQRQVRLMDKTIRATEMLAYGDTGEIRLPRSLKKLQDELNMVRRQMLRAKQDETEAEQKKNDLIMYLAHDLKTPLTSVIGYLNLLRDNPELSIEKKTEYAGIALDKAERLEELIGEFFDITRLTMTTMTLQPEKRNLSMMLEQIMYEFQPILEEKGMYWRAMIQPNVVCYFDPDKMERVFENLIRNAINYSYDNTELVMGMKVAGNMVRIRLMNHGATISEEKLKHLFEQFFRVDNSRSTDTGGAGLGLAITKEIVELHGGRIRAASKDETVSFMVELPLKRTK